MKKSYSRNELTPLDQSSINYINNQLEICCTIECFDNLIDARRSTYISYYKFHVLHSKYEFTTTQCIKNVELRIGDRSMRDLKVEYLNIHYTRR